MEISMDYDDNLAFIINSTHADTSALMSENEMLKRQNRSLNEQLRELRVSLEQETGPKNPRVAV